MSSRILLSLILVACLAIIGCGGEGVPDNGFTDGTTSTATTNGSTNGSTTGDESPFAGNYDGFVEGGNTTGTRFSGEGFADIFEDGEAVFWFDAFINNVLYSRSFEGRVDDAGNFEGFTHTGERATGTVQRDGDALSATIVWVKRTANGNVFYTETTNLSMFRQ